MSARLPTGWKTIILGEHAEFRNGVNFTTKSNGKTVKVLGVSDFAARSVIDDFSQMPIVTLSNDPKADDYLKDGDFVFVRSNGSKDLIGRCAMVFPLTERVMFSGFTIRMRLTSKQMLPRFWLTIAKSELFKKALHEHGSGSYITNLSQETLSEIEVSLPSLKEQHRIVAVLDAWHQAIEQTERLITAKQRRKSALFQKLFRNLPKRPLLEAADVWFSGVDKKSRADEAPVLLCNYMDVFHNSRITSAIDFMPATASRSQIAENTLRKHDVVFTKDSETSEEIAEPALVDEDIPNLVCGYHLAIARPRDGVGYGPFIAQAMRHQAIRWQFNRLANGVVRFGLTLDAIEQAEIFLPSMAVQERIASVLDAEDVLIDDLRKRAEILRTQKRGLMQKLLTGEWQLDGRFDPPKAATIGNA